jgi:ATP-binding cassette subfamily F protein 3
LLSVTNLTLRYGDRLLLESVSFIVNRGERVGLIGPNGAGKSSLLRVIAGAEPATSGGVTVPPRVRVGFLRQGFADQPEGTLADLLDGPTSGLVSSLAAMDLALARYADPAADPDQVAADHQRATDMFEQAGGYAAVDRLQPLLNRFGLANIAFTTPLRELSGGQKTRAGLAALLASEPDLLLLDEPTNHLDLDALAWLEGFLQDYDGTVLIVSHDRAFLDAVVTRILELDPETRSLASWVGNYAAYVAARAHQEAELHAAYHRQQKEIARITEDIRGAEHHARTIEANTIDYAIRAKAAKIARPAVVRKRKLEKLLDSTDYIEKPALTWGLDVEFAPSSGGARDVVAIEHATLGYAGHPVLTGVSLQIRHGEKVALLGPNGAGKSTLIRTITGELPPLSGSVRLGPGVQAGYFAQEQDTIDPALTIMEQARRVASGSESDLRTFLHKFLFGGEMVHRRIGSLSYGERARLMLAILVLQGTTLLLLDEPLNHLDLDAREEFERALQHFTGTVILVLHDRYAIERLASRTIEVRDGRAVERDPASLVTAER